MDLLRASLKALFYDYSIQFIADKILSKNSQQLLSRFPVVVQWREQYLTRTEIDNLQNIIQTTWFMNKESVSLSEISKPLCLLNEFSELVLRYDRENGICVIYDNLLRWRQISYVLGQDIFITSYLGRKFNDSDNFSFDWSNCIPCDKDAIYVNDEDGLPDIHTHLWGSVDYAELYWICIMNNISLWSDNPDERINSRQMDVDYDLNIEGRKTLRDWTSVASCIRIALLKWISDTNPDSEFSHEKIDWLIECMDDGFSSWRNDGFQEELCQFKEGSFRLQKFGNVIWDYAIRKDYQLAEKEFNSPFWLHYGERHLLYSCFQKIYHNGGKKVDVQKASEYLYLYLLIKIRFRKEHIYTNPLKGLANFIDYGIAKSTLQVNDETYKLLLNKIFYIYAIQSSVGLKHNNDIESRLSIKDYKGCNNIPISTSIASTGAFIYSGKLSFVISISKSFNKSKMESNIDIILRESSEGNSKLVGIDFCGYEGEKRPIFFSPFIRYLRKKGIKNFTYHVGEDFVDVLDGLRAIDELLTYAEFDSYCRLGHALVLGIDVSKYYRERHNIVILKEQDLLDNLVWLYCKVDIKNDESGCISEIEKKIKSLLKKFEYGDNIDDYYKSISLRSEPALVDDSYSIPCNANDCIRENGKIRALYEKYHSQGSTIVSYQYPSGIDVYVKNLQDKVIHSIIDENISIEACPSSNLCVGGFRRYDNLPLMRLIDKKIPISINTDDKGVFSTSIEQEYALIALSMGKGQVINKQDVPKILSDFIQTSRNQRFEKEKIN